MKNPLDFVRPNILALKPYSTARDEFTGGDIDVWVDANENPYDNGVNRYPDPHHKDLKKRISEIKGISPEMIFIGGTGSDEAIDLTFRIFCNPRKDKTIIIEPTYGVYGVAAQINDVEIVHLSLDNEFNLPVTDILDVIKSDKDIKLIWICSPNNPTGNAFPKEDILKIADEFNGIVAVDEAYVDFSEKGTLLHDIQNHPNIIVLQTFSKAWGMASLRCGMAFSVPEIAQIYNNVKNPYNVNGPTQKLIIELSKNLPTEKITEIIKERERLRSELSKLDFVKKIYPSDANFLLVEVNNPKEVYDYLISKGIIVRNRSNVPGCGKSLRITVGTPTENDKILSTLKLYRGI